MSTNTKEHVRCLCCGGPIPPGRRGNARYCSRHCAAEARNTRHMERQPLQACVICGKLFRPRRDKNQRACSLACGYKLVSRNTSNRKSHNEVIGTISGWPDVFRVAKAYHPERFAELNADRPEFQRNVIRKFDSAVVPGEKNDIYAWFYNHVLYPDDPLAQAIADGIRMAHAIRSANGVDFIKNEKEQGNRSYGNKQY